MLNRQIFLIFIILLLKNSFIFSQSNPKTGIYPKGTINVGLGVGFGMYGAQDNDTSSVETRKIDAICGLIPAFVDYSISKAFTIGFQFERNGFLTEKDSTTGYKNRGNSINFDGTLKYRIINRKKCTHYDIFSKRIPTGGSVLSSNLLLGYSYFTYKYKDALGNKKELHGDGIHFQLCLQYDHYFNETIGYFLNASYNIYYYFQMFDEDFVLIEVNNKADILAMTLSGINLRGGLSIKFWK